MSARDFIRSPSRVMKTQLSCWPGFGAMNPSRSSHIQPSMMTRAIAS